MAAGMYTTKGYVSTKGMTRTKSGYFAQKMSGGRKKVVRPSKRKSTRERGKSERVRSADAKAMRTRELNLSLRSA